MPSTAPTTLEQMPFYHPFFIDQAQVPHLASPFTSSSSKAGCSSSSSSARSRASSTTSVDTQSSSTSSSTRSITFAEASLHTSFVPGLPRDHPFNTRSCPPSPPTKPKLNRAEQAAWIAQMERTEHLFGSVARRGRGGSETAIADLTDSEAEVEEKVEENKGRGRWFRRSKQSSAAE